MNAFLLYCFLGAILIYSVCNGIIFLVLLILKTECFYLQNKDFLFILPEKYSKYIYFVRLF